MFFRKQTGTRCCWQWGVRRRLSHLVYTLGVFSLSILLLVSYPLTGNGDDVHLFGKPTVSVLPIQTFSPATNDQLERTDGVLGSRQMIQASVSSVMPRRIFCDADARVFLSFNSVSASLFFLVLLMMLKITKTNYLDCGKVSSLRAFFLK